MAVVPVIANSPSSTGFVAFATFRVTISFLTTRENNIIINKKNSAYEPDVERLFFERLFFSILVSLPKKGTENICARCTGEKGTTVPCLS